MTVVPRRSIRCDQPCAIKRAQTRQTVKCWMVSSPADRCSLRGDAEMKTLIRLEELMLAVLSFYLFLGLNYAWWWFPVLFLVPDISLVAYLINRKVGAISYNLVHHKA